jgi:hypothetical protein
MLKSEIAKELILKIRSLGYSVKYFSNGSVQLLDEEIECYSEFSSCVLGFEKEITEIKDCFSNFPSSKKKILELYPLSIQYVIFGNQDLYFKIKIVDTMEINSHYTINTYLYIPIGIVTKLATKESRLFKYISSVFYMTEKSSPSSKHKKITKINDSVWIRKELKDVFLTEFMEELQSELGQP